MTKDHIEQRQVRMLQHPAMLFAYVYDRTGNVFGYLTRQEFINLNPYPDNRMVKTYPAFCFANKQNQAKPKLRTIKLSDISDIKLATSNNY